MASLKVARALVLPIAALISFAAGARADITPIDLSTFVNSDLTTFTGGGNYPQQGGPLTVDGIPFVLATIGPNQDTAILEASQGGYDIPIDTFGVDSADVLMNSAWGICGITVGEIDFVGSSGTYVYSLQEGTNIRDHYQGDFCNSSADVTASANFGPDRLDMYSIQLPAAFLGETLESIDFVGYGEYELGTPFLAALDIDPPSPAPEPSATLLVLIAGASLALIRRLKRGTPFVPFGRSFEGVSQG
jgi:hypothetical protein